ncbi:MAG: hypothetical protein JRI68_15225 [Deltaproteobacteria bacterium]|nr:hypothetical protein [Deltaproteobacteria bacterium]
MTIEATIKAFAREQREGLLVGIAGPERLHGPPSVDPSYTLRGARSIVSIAVPMHVPAIYDFLSKRSPVPHNVDQARGNQEVFRICERIAQLLGDRGHRAKAAPVNSDYRPSLDTIAFHPAFSHRYGALMTGIAGQGWSGNVVTREYGAAVFLGTVVTRAKLRSDPAMGPQEIHDERCSKCKLCEKSCPVAMFERDREERFLLGGALYPRGRRKNIDLCTASCFGMHGLSRDKRWTSWGAEWIDEWVEGVPEPENRAAVRRLFLRQVFRAGDSGMRVTLIQRTTERRVADDTLDVLPPVDRLPEDRAARARIQRRFASAMGLAELRNPNILTCGQCCLVCGPTLEERARRHRMLTEGGLVVPNEEGDMVRATSFEQARKIRQNRRRPTREQRSRDGRFLARYTGHYFGLDLSSEARGLLYRLAQRRALRS